MFSPRFRRPLLLLLAVLLNACGDGGGGGPVQPEREEPDITWLRQNAVPFATTQPGGSLADLAPLGAMIGSARIVGLGEATHGSREFFTMKHRVIEYLVREKGFRVFGIEATWAEALRINRYVHTGEGDPAVLLSNLYFWTWNTQEVLDLILWMRAYNQSVSADRRVSFYGIDMQASRVAMDDVEAYVGAVDPAAGDRVSAHYACYRLFQDEIGRAQPDYSVVAEATRQQCREGVRAAYAVLSQNEAAYVAATGRPAYDAALQTARVVVQNEDARGTLNPGTLLRDQYMAENTAWLAQRSGGAGVVLWAHNGHVARLQPYMGTHLAYRFGGDYVPVGFSFHRGGLNAVEMGVGLRAHQAPPAAVDSYEHQFDRLGHGGFLLDLRPLRAAGLTAETRWMLGPRPFRMVGAVYRPGSPQDFYFRFPLPEQYDVMIHVTQVTPTQLLPFRYQ
jgi:erythromycin esterase